MLRILRLWGSCLRAVCVPTIYAITTACLACAEARRRGCGGGKCLGRAEGTRSLLRSPPPPPPPLGQLAPAGVAAINANNAECLNPPSPPPRPKAAAEPNAGAAEETAQPIGQVRRRLSVVSDNKLVDGIQDLDLAADDGA